MCVCLRARERERGCLRVRERKAAAFCAEGQTEGGQEELSCHSFPAVSEEARCELSGLSVGPEQKEVMAAL